MYLGIGNQNKTPFTLLQYIKKCGRCIKTLGICMPHTNFVDFIVSENSAFIRTYRWTWV